MRRRSDTLKVNLCQAQQRNLKTIASLSHRPIVLTDTIGYRTIGFLHYCPNPSIDRKQQIITQHSKYILSTTKHGKLGSVG